MPDHSKTAIHLTVDDRERSSPLVPIFEAMEDIALSVGRLRVGDYRADSSLLVERKTSTDLAASIRSGRLFRQAAVLARAPLVRACLIIEESGHHGERPAVPRRAVQGALITITLVYGLPVLHSLGPADSAHLIRCAARQLRRREARGPLRWVPRSSSDRRLRILMLEAVPNLGPRRAAALLDTFGSVEAIAAAPAEQLAAAPGIGPTISRRLKQIVSGPETRDDR